MLSSTAAKTKDTRPALRCPHSLNERIGNGLWESGGLQYLKVTTLLWTITLSHPYLACSCLLKEMFWSLWVWNFGYPWRRSCCSLSLWQCFVFPAAFWSNTFMCFKKKAFAVWEKILLWGPSRWDNPGAWTVKKSVWTHLIRELFRFQAWCP